MYQAYRDLVARITALIEKGPDAVSAGTVVLGAATGPEFGSIETIDDIVLGVEPVAGPQALGAVLIVTLGGILCSQNAQARQAFGLEPGTGVGAAALSPAVWCAALEGLRAAGGPVALMLVDAAGAPRPMLAAALPAGDRAMICEATSGLSPAAQRALVQLHGLSRAEHEVLALLASGQGVEAAARALGRGIGTARQQVKAILSKMGVHSQAQAVARALALGQTLDRVALAVEGRATVPSLAFALDGPGGPVSVQRFGLAGGMPVLMFHGALAGIAPLPAIRGAAQALGLDVIAPERPGYGATPLPDGADPLALAVAQARDALAACGVAGRVVLLGHDIGSKFACAFARACPDRVAAVVLGPTTPPMRGWAQTADMPARHRVNAWAAQRMPAVMDRIVALGIGQIRKKGVEMIPALVYADCDFDRAAMVRPDMQLALQEVFAMVAMQSAAGFRHDMRLTNMDWSGWAAEVAAPVTALHGAQSATVSRAAVAAFAAALPRGRVEVVPGAGHTMPLTHPEFVLRQVFRAGVAAGL